MTKAFVLLALLNAEIDPHYITLTVIFRTQLFSFL